MRNPATVAGHPIHPMLVVVPIGLWIFSLAADLIAIGAERPELWRALAFYTMAGGLIGALLAAAPGFVDWLSLAQPRVRQIATYHMALNLAVVALYAVNLYLRTQLPPGARAPVILSVAAVALLAVSGWLGGELVYVHGVGVQAPRGEQRPETRIRRVG
jgi:uncharacterized membrane protein